MSSKLLQINTGALRLIPFLRIQKRQINRKGAKSAKEKCIKTREELDELSRHIVDCCIKVHRALGPGLLESSYQLCLAHELRSRGFEVRTEVVLPVRYAGIEIEAGYRIDMIVEDCIIVENKAVQAVIPVLEAQLITYLKLSGRKLGFLINWNVPLIKDGIKRVVNDL
jgi:GxxExxY protein